MVIYIINTILIDDEYWIIEGLKKLINWEENGCKIIGSFTNTIEAAEFVFLNRHRIDLIITDIRLGGSSGLDFIKEQKEILSPDTKYVVISAYQDFHYAKQALNLGVDSFIEKPIEAEELLNVISNISNSKRALANYAPQNSKETPKQTVSRILDYSLKNFTDPYFSLSSIAEHFHLTNKYISSIFKKHTGINFTTHIKNLRIEYSKALLENSNKSLKDIAISCGFADYYYFSKVFKQSVGMSPTDYKKDL